MNREALREELDKRKMTVDELSDLAGIDRSTIYRVINGTSNCTVETATRIVAALRLKPAVAMSIFFDE